MTNCEDCVYYEYDPEADTNYRDKGQECDGFHRVSSVQIR